MNRLEFDEVMKVMEINNLLSITTGENNVGEKIDIYFGDGYYAIVKGKIPLEVANLIYEKYPNNIYQIRIGSGYSDLNPNEQAIDDKYKKDIQKYIEQNLDADKYLINYKKPEEISYAEKMIINILTPIILIQKRDL